MGTLGFVDDSEDRHSVEQLPTGVCVGKTIKSPAGEIRYHVGRLLGEGNFGRVFEGIPASQSQKQAALKVFKNTEKKAEACEEALHHLNLGAHPHRVTLYEVLLIELNKAEKATRTQPAGGELLVAMDLAGGELQRLIYGGSDRRGDRGPLFDLPEGEVQATALRFASQLAAALAAMHNGENSRNNEKRYLHCDVSLSKKRCWWYAFELHMPPSRTAQVKPENALVSGQNLKLIDFGGASAFVANSSERQGFVWSTVSTVSHASPELIKLRERLRTSRRAAAREAYVNLQLSVRLREQAKFAWNGQVGKFDRPQLLNKKPDQASDIWKQLNEDAIPTVNRAMLEAKQRFLYSELVTPQITGARKCIHALTSPG